MYTDISSMQLNSPQNHLARKSSFESHLNTRQLFNVYLRHIPTRVQ